MSPGAPRPEVPGLRIVTLAETPQAMVTAACWMHRAFLRRWGLTRDDARHLLRHRCNVDALPKTFLAILGERFVGMASLIVDEHPAVDPDTCWLSGLYVQPSRRGQGIGAGLLRRCLSEAAVFGHARLHLMAHDAHGYYASMGWHENGIVAEPFPEGPVRCTLMSHATPSLAVWAAAHAPARTVRGKMPAVTRPPCPGVPPAQAKSPSPP